MLNGLWKLTWLEIKIFVREPLGLIGTVAVPVVAFAVLGRALDPGDATLTPESQELVLVDLPIFAAILIVLSTVLSLVTIIAIYREGGILKRLRATPLRPHTILLAHVLVKLLSTAVTLGLLILAGRRFYPLIGDVPVLAFTLALLFTTASILSFGFVIASLVPTARFAQPVGAAIFYPMVALSGLFVPVAALPAALQAVARLLPLTYAVSLLEGVWRGAPLTSHLVDIGVLTAMAGMGLAVSAKVFRWE